MAASAQIVPGYPTGVTGQPVCGTSGGQVVNCLLYTDASQYYTSSMNGDMCAAINAAIADAVSKGIFTVDARAFTGLQACKSDPYHNEFVPIHILLSGKVTIITSTPWTTPALPNVLTGEVGGNTADTAGARIMGCGSVAGLATGVTFTAGTGGWPASGSPGNCAFNSTILGVTIQNTSGHAGTVTELNGTTAAFQMTFHSGITHGPFPSGTYQAVIEIGAERNNGDGYGADTSNNSDCDDTWISNVAISTGGDQNTFGIYDPCSQEKTTISHVRLGCCGGGANWNAAGAFFDRTEYAYGNGNAAGVTRPVISDVNLAGEMTSQCNTASAACYGIVFQGSAIQCVVSGGGGSGGTCYVPQGAVSGGSISLSAGAVVVANPGTGYSGTATVTLSGPGQTWGSALNQTASCTAAESGGFLTTITCSSGGMNYPGAVQTGGPMITHVAVAGAAAAKLWDAIYIDGTGLTEIKNVHNINAANYAVEWGITTFNSGGVIQNVDTSTACGVHLGWMHDGGETLQSIVGSSVCTTVIQDDLFGQTLTLAQFSRGIGSYDAASFISNLYGFLIPCQANTPASIAPTTTFGVYCDTTDGLDFQPGADSTQAVTIRNHAGTVGFSFDTSNGRLAIGKAGAPTAALDVTGTFQVTNGGAISKYDNFSTAGVGVPVVLYATGSGTQTGNFGPTTMFAGIAGTHWYRFSWFVDQVNVGTGSCTSTATTIVLNLVWTPANASIQTTLPMIGFGPNTNTGGITSTITIATSGSPLGANGQVAASGSYTFTSKASQAITFTVTGFAGPTGCTTAPNFEVIPLLEILN